MTLLGIASSAEPKKPLPPWGKMLANGSLFGGGLVGAGAVVLAIVGLIRANPDKGFVLLEKWGPWFILSIFALWAVNGVANRMIDVGQDLGNRFADSMDRIADEQVKLADSSRDQADAMKRSADRDDRDTERLSTLIEYSARHSRQAVESVGAVNASVEALHSKLDKLLQKET